MTGTNNKVYSAKSITVKSRPKCGSGAKDGGVSESSRAAIPEAGRMLYADVILPLKLGGRMTYAVPEGLEGITRGTWVEVNLAGRIYYGVVDSLKEQAPGLDPLKIRPVISLPPLPPVSEKDLHFWRSIADYYMCSEGEVLKAAYPQNVRRQAEVKSRKTAVRKGAEPVSPLPQLSAAQAKALAATEEALASKKSVLLNGVTGSGKTEIYMHLAMPRVEAGGQVLYLVPEIAMSRQLQERLESVFGDRLLVFHSKLTAPQKKKVLERLAEGGPCIVLGTRSAIFLPLSNLRMVIVDEEHDSSYKQDDPAPRYNGRDAALLLASQRGASVVLGSATPSYEALYNVAAGKYVQVDLLQRYHRSPEAKVKIIDTRKAMRLKDMKGSFSRELLADIRKTLEKGEQVLVFRSRRAYSPVVQCLQCGDIPKCPKCNVPLSYHKYNNTLECHYCGWHTPFDGTCKACGSAEMAPRGAGTEKLEEELKEYFPEARVERFDAQTTESKTAEREMLTDFAEGRIDILVGTQMITKGFDFANLSLVAVVQADSLFSLQDFRADERALQLLSQLRGRAGRREAPGRMAIQTCQPDHPVLKRLTGKADEELRSGSLAERKMFGYPPFVRLVVITVKERSEGRLWHMERDIRTILGECGVNSALGPVRPPVEKIDNRLISQFWVKLPRNNRLAPTKNMIKTKLDSLRLRYGQSDITVDVDPQ